ncbi:hypothetical protein F5Y06DRAFT_270974 [Hypoxylon sp. FL0890]|nr:hypothetical protein F5Y06DRAFT_270974 [Hypoxylon sp. FL0890]
MAKLLFLLCLVTIILCVLSPTNSSVTLDQLFIVQSGGADGGCDKYFNQASKDGTLDDWLEEINLSLATVFEKIELGVYNQDIRVRRAFESFFGVRNRGKASENAQQTIKKISENIGNVLDFFRFAPGEDGREPKYPLNGNRYLFCGSDFLVHQTEDTPALDWEANEILDDEGNPVSIVDVPNYAKALGDDPDNEAWWSGDLTLVNGYYFTATGGEYCDSDNLGLTAKIDELEADVTGQPTKRKPIEFVILCDHSFTNTERPDSYKVGNAAIVAGTNLATVVPKSATFLHEAFHLIFGVEAESDDPNNPGGFLEGDEIYDLGQCIDTARTNPVVKARRNPENYVFFITHMYYLFGEQSEGIDTNWDFGITGRGSKLTYAARQA